MANRFTNSMDVLKEDLKKTLDYFSYISEMLKNAFETSSYTEDDLVLAKTKMNEITSLVYDINNDVALIISRYEPKTYDLRFVISIIHAANDVARSAEHCYKILKDFTKEGVRINNPIYIINMLSFASDLLCKSVDLLFNNGDYSTTDLEEVEKRIDDLRRDIIRHAIGRVSDDGTKIGKYYYVINSAKRIERVADHAMNIISLHQYIKNGARISMF